MAAVDYFLKLDGISGESTDETHKGEIDISSFRLGESNFVTVGSAAAGQVSGKVAMQDIHFSMVVNKASPSLMLACATGKHISTGTLTARKAGDQGVEFLKVVLTDVLVSSFQTGGTNDALPQDSFSLNFLKLELDYTPQDVTGALLPAVQVGFDVAANAGA